MKNLYKFYLVLITLSIISYFYFDKEIACFFHQNIEGELRHYIKMFSKLGQAEYYLIPSGVLWLIYRKKDKFITKASALIFSTVAVSGILIDIIKVIVARYRPPMLFSDNLYGFKGFDFGFLVNSFPSGHSTTAFSVGVALMLLFPKYKYIFLLFASLIALSRVFLAVHFFSDIMMGALFGTITSIYLYNKIFKENNENKL